MKRFTSFFRWLIRDPFLVFFSLPVPFFNFGLIALFDEATADERDDEGTAANERDDEEAAANGRDNEAA